MQFSFWVQLHKLRALFFEQCSKIMCFLSFSNQITWVNWKSWFSNPFNHQQTCGGLVVRCQPWEQQTLDRTPLFLWGIYQIQSYQQLLLLKPSTAMQVRSSVRSVPQNQPSGWCLLPSPKSWLPDQHHTAMLADISQHILVRNEGSALRFGQLVRTHIPLT